MKTAEILKTHNAWRRGEIDTPMDELGYTNQELGLAIDDAVEIILARENQKERMAHEAVIDIKITCEPVAWRTEDYQDDNSATTYSKEVATRWIAKGWPVWPLYAHAPTRTNASELADALTDALEFFDNAERQANEQVERFREEQDDD